MRDLCVVYHPDYVAPLPEGHRFPMAKFRQLYELLLQDEIINPQSVYISTLPTSEWLELAHCPHYINAYCEGTLDHYAQRRIGLPWSEQLAKRTQIAVGGTILTAQLALKQGIACNLAGGTHHAFPNYGSGFCIFNDLAVAARTVQKLGLARQILIIDLDVHQGDGTAWIFHNDPSVFTFSMHCEANFPAKKQQSDLDISLNIGLEDDQYLAILKQYIPDLLAQVKPDLIFYDAGVDVHSSDRLGKLCLTNQGIYQRDHFILQECLKQNYPVATVIGGGYSHKFDDLVYRHSLVCRAALTVNS
jgi:acetoin utilization deacetylase AcuC-like enzyme